MTDSILKPWVMPLRRWQQEALEKYDKKPGPDFLLEATPGAGKTIAALRIARYLIDAGEVDYVVVVTNTDTLRDQWSVEGSSVGVLLDPDAGDLHKSGGARLGFRGVVGTYQQLAAMGGRASCALGGDARMKRTIVILDEIHHAGDGLAWGDSVETSFRPAPRRLSLSGTPFRSDDVRISFVTYDEKGLSVPDYRYGYGEALKDGNVVRAATFPKWDGHMEWTVDGAPRAATFAAELPDAEEARRLRTALSTEGEWLPRVLGTANHKLTDLRAGHRDAGGLVLAISIEHANSIGAMLERITGEKAVIATSEDPSSTAKIKAFAKGGDRWLVSVRKVSEGVDVKRLRVLVYATNITSELFFRQALGRIVRWTPGVDDEQFCYFFTPADRRLLAYAQSIREERDHALKIRDDVPPGGPDTPPGGPRGPRVPSGFVPGDSVAIDAGVIHEGSTYSPGELEEARRVADQTEGRYSTETVARLARLIRAGTGPAAATATIPSTAPYEEPLHEKLRRLRTSLSTYSKSLAGLVLRTTGDTDAFRTVNREILARFGTRDRMGEIHLNGAIAWCRRCMTVGSLGDHGLGS